MSYGYELYNDAGQIVASSDDQILTVYAKYSINGGSTISQTTYDYSTSQPYNFPNQITNQPNFRQFSMPVSVSTDLFYGFAIPNGSTLFIRYMYNNSGGRMILCNTTTITLIVAGPLKALSNYPATWGMIGYNDAGTATFHSDANVLKIIKKIDGTGTMDAGGYTPVYFMSGNYFYHKTTSGPRYLRMCGVRQNSLTSYTRRCDNNVGVSLPSDISWETDPLGNGFIASVDLSLF